MKKLMFATALVASAAAFADPTALNAISFEGYSENATFTNGAVEKGEDGNDKSGNPFFYYDGEGDGSSVKLFATGEAGAVTAPKRPYYFQGVSPAANYLELSTEGGTLWRSINPISVSQGETTTYGLGTAQDIATDGTYLDTLVQFTPTEDGGAPELDAADKLAIWLNVDQNSVTNLMVKAGSYDDEGALAVGGASYVLTGKTVLPGTWYRLTVKAVDNILPANDYYKVPGFQVFIDGQEMSATTSPLSAVWLASLQEGEVLSAAQVTELSSGKYLPSRLAGENGVTSTLQGVGFKGSGALDDIVWTEENPFQAPAGIDFSLTWPSGLTAVSYTIGNGSAESLTGETSPFAVPGLEGGETVYFLVQNADGAQKTLTATAADGEGIDATSTTFTWADYLGDAVAGAYTIDDANDRDMLRKGVLSGLATSNETFKQTANIDMSGVTAWPGIGTYAANLSSGVSFQGTYDGQDYTISNLDFSQRTYGGVFNQVKGGTIKNLTVENITCSTIDPSVSGGEWGCAIVGNAGLGATLQNLVAKGSFGTATTPCSHNVAGIAVRVCGGASNVVDGVAMLETLVKDCTNNATLYGFYTKAAGITALTQDQNGVPNDYVKFDGCVNNSNIAMVEVAASATTVASTLSKIGRDGLAGILGYVADGTKIKDCVNNGTLTSALTTAKIGGVVGWAQGRFLDDLGGNVASAALPMVGSYADSYENGVLKSHCEVSGFQYAAVANNVATTVLPPLTAGATYLLEGDVAASETPVATLAAAGDTIAFDTTLGYTFAGTVDSAVAALGVSSATAGTVTTYTAFDAVAQVNAGAKYATLQAAVDAATAGDTVTVLADCTISTPLSITNNITVHNDHTITGAVNYAICIGATVSFEGSGKIERASGITGSAFCVGANETTRGAITAGTAGTLNFTGLTVCGGSGGNLIKLENGTVTMNGGVLRDGKRGIKADADVGNYTSAIVINGGTITNNTDCAVMASAASADGTATVTINGGVIAGALTIDGTAGTYSITIPGTSTAMFDADQSAFCASGYETTDGDSDGWFTVSAVQSGSDYKVTIDGSDVVVTPSAEDLAVVQAAVVAGGGTLDVTDVAAVNAAMAAPIGTTGIPSWQALFLGLPPTAAGLESFKIDSISIGADGKVTVALPASVDPKTGRGVTITLKLMGSDDLSTWSFIENASGTTFSAVTPGSGETKKFYKVVVEFAGSSN